MPKEHIEKFGTSLLFFRSSLRALDIIGIILLFTVIGLLCYAIYQIMTIPEPSYFATTSDGRIIQLYPEK